MVGSNKHFVNMFIGANGVGKSAIGANIVANICYGAQNRWFKEKEFKWTDQNGLEMTREAIKLPLFKKFPYLKRGRIIADPTTLKEKIVPELKKWFPENESKRFPIANYTTTKEGKNYAAKFTTNTGHEFDLMSNEQDLKEFESVDLGWAWFDEPPSKKIFLATIARMRRGGIIFLTYTPLFHAGWLKDYINDNAGSDEFDYVEAEMEDNCRQHGVRGILEHGDIKRMADSFPPDEKMARVFGKFGHLIGRVHKRFNRKIHVIKPFPIDEKRYTTYMALDPHPRTPDHALWMAVDKNGRKYITAELITKGKTAELKERMHAIETKNNFRMEDRIIDPSAYNDDQHREEPSVGSLLFDLGMYFIKGSKDLSGGIRRTDDAFDYEIVGGEMVKKPEVYIFDTCVVAIKQLEEYVWDEHKGRGADMKQKKGTPRDKDDHQPENLHRLLMHNPQFVHYEDRMSSVINFNEENELDPYDH